MLNRPASAPTLEASPEHNIILQLLIEPPRLWVLMLTTLIPAAIAAGLLITPMQVYSRQATWDLLFNLDGAWRLYNGQICHIDFHTELGSLPFALTALGFHIFGLNVIAFLAGECIFAAAVLILGITVVIDRLPLIPAAIFVAFCTIISLMPSAYSDMVRGYTFATSYNRYGWSISGILFVLLFIEPFNAGRSSWKDYSMCATLLVLLYYIKITYFSVGIVAFAVALLAPGHVRTNKQGWLGVFALIMLFASAPFNFDYSADIRNAALAGGTRTYLGNYVRKFLNDPTEYSIALMSCLVLTAAPLKWQMRHRAVIASFLTIAGILLLSQNAEEHGIATYGVICLLVYSAVRDLAIRQMLSLNHHTCCLLLAPLVFPLFISVSCGMSLAYYSYLQLKRGEFLFVVTDTNLKNLAVPLRDKLVPLESVPHQEGVPSRFNKTGFVGPYYMISQLEYIHSLLNFSSNFSGSSEPTNAPRHILNMDRVNALPFLLGLPAPRGVDLWWGDEWGRGLINRSEDDIFADVDIVAVPLYSIGPPTTELLMERYGAYIRAHFSFWRETPEWIIFRRPNLDGNASSE